MSATNVATLIKKENYKNQKRSIQKSLPKDIKGENWLRMPTSQRRPLIPKYQSIFLGTCFSCNNFGHKATNCKLSSNKRPHNSSKVDHVRHERNENYFGLNLEFFKCHKFSHKDEDCRSNIMLTQRNEGIPKFGKEN